MGRSKQRKKPDEPRLRPDLKHRTLAMGTLHGHLDRARTEPLGEEAYLDLKQAIDTLAFLNQEVERKGASLEKQRHILFGPRTESTTAVTGATSGRRKSVICQFIWVTMQNNVQIPSSN